MQVEKTIAIKNKQGLHARPAALFVQTANKYSAEITIAKGRQKVNGKSIMGIMMLEAGVGSKITGQHLIDRSCQSVDVIACDSLAMFLAPVEEQLNSGARRGDDRNTGLGGLDQHVGKAHTVTNECEGHIFSVGSERVERLDEKLGGFLAIETPDEADHGAIERESERSADLRSRGRR